MSLSRPHTLGFIGLLLFACNGKDTGDSSSAPPPLDGFTLSGVVLDVELEPLQGVVVTAGDSSATSNASGGFSFRELPEEVELVAELEGYATGWRRVGFTAQSATVALTLLPVSTTTLAEGARSLADESGLSVAFEGDFLDADGVAVTGDIDASWQLLDRRPEAWALPPTVDESGDPILGLAAMVLELSQGGAPLDFVGVATVTLPAAPLAPLDEAEELALFSYDPEQGVWVNQGEATLTDAGLLSFEAGHFSWWLVGTRGEPGCLEGELFTLSGDTAEGAVIEAVTVGGASLVESRYPTALGLRQGEHGSWFMATPPMAEELGMEARALWTDPGTGQLVSWSWPGSERGETELSPDGCVLCGTGMLGAARQDADGDGYTPIQGDCDDGDASVSPGATDTVGDGIDDNCDGVDGEDADGDGWASTESGGGDCDDATAGAHPGSALDLDTDGSDQDCDGVDGIDQDGDGYAAASVGGDDCDDTDASVHPGAADASCDGIDSDCSGDTEWLLPDHHATLQAAIDASADGDAICVAAGTYSGDADLGGKNLEIVGLEGSALTILEGDGSGPVVTMANGEGAATLLEGFTLRGGQAACGGGLLLDGASPVLHDLVIEGNSADQGGGLCAIASGATLSEIALRGNQAVDLGGGLWASGCTLTVDGLTASGNSALGGGGLYLLESSGSWNGIEILDNVADTTGGGLWIEGFAKGVVSLTDARVSGNQAADGGGVAFTGDASIERWWIEGNTASGSGGGLQLISSLWDAALLQADQLVLLDNQAASGGGAHVSLWADFDVEHLYVAGNQASASGGGVLVDDMGDLDAQQALVLGNRAARGAGLGLDVGQCTLIQAGIVGNVASDGGAGVFLNDSVLHLLDVDLSFNEGGSGAGLQVEGAATQLELRYSNLWGNSPAESAIDPDSAWVFEERLGADPELLSIAGEHPRDWILQLAATSPLIDAGDPGLSDPDGSRADIGAYGGSGADSWDLDDDGFPAWWRPGPYDFQVDPAAGWDEHDLDPDLHPDADDDGDGYTPVDGDCDDTAAQAFPGGAEVCDGLDNDCDGVLDSSEADLDGDGGLACDDDCDDDDPSVYAGAPELCDGIDNDCDGAVPADEGDADADGFMACEECGDADATIHPGADELCDGIDNDCDGDVDEDDAVDTTYWYEDLDGDGVGNAAVRVLACSPPSGWVAESGDCDDTTAAVGPYAEEICDGDDNDCDGLIDDEATDADIWYQDLDGDGWGDSTVSATACTQPTGWVAADGDCDDGDAAIHPGASERCNGMDDDCDGAVPADERDDDGDGWLACEECGDGDASVFPGAMELCNGMDDDCDGMVPADESDSDGDGWLACAECDDSDASVFPGASELCDGIDNDCDGAVPADENDTDGDGWLACAECDDGDATVFPGASELCDGIDNDCDGSAPADESDTDGDGWLACEECDDGDSAVHPGADELCDSVDNDCDGAADEEAVDAPTWFQDADGDGYGDITVSTTACTQPTGFVADATDCDDGEPLANPGEAEVCGDGIDNDCDGTATGCTPMGELDLGSADASFYGEAGYDYAGSSLAGLGDINGDGYGDLLIGAYGSDTTDTEAGAAYLFLGPFSGSYDAIEADGIMLGGDPNDRLGWGVGAAGDVDNDGLTDYLIGAPTADGAVLSSGYVGLVYGSTSVSAALTPDVVISGEATADWLGKSMDFAGDVNGDGFADFLLGAPDANPVVAMDGRSYLFLGPLSASTTASSAALIMDGEGWADQSGIAVSGAGDVDGDGLDDLLIGATGDDDAFADAGAAYLVLGTTRGYLGLGSADAKITGDADNDGVGVALDAAGDVNGDGYGDLLIGASGHDGGGTNAGAAFVVLGPLSGSSTVSDAYAALQGEAAQDSAGGSVAGNLDTDLDGEPDLLIGAVYVDGSSLFEGGAYLVRGPIEPGTMNLGEAALRLDGEGAADRIGDAVANAGDTDGDGTDDLLVGSGLVTGSASSQGAAYLVLSVGL